MTPTSIRNDANSRTARLALGGGPGLSIIIAADVSRAWLDRLLAVLPRQGRSSRIEVLLVRAGVRRPGEERDVRHPLVRYVTAPAAGSRAELRAQAVRYAAGDFLMLLDDDAPVNMMMIERFLGSVSGGERNEREVHG
jgi:hypothetical protein